jgi:hypothetical protein
MSIIKTAFFFLVLVSMVMGSVYVKQSVQHQANANRIAQIAPIIIGNNGTVRFPQRVPSPETVFQIQTAIQTDDAQKLNDLLVRHRFYVLPGRKE